MEGGETVFPLAQNRVSGLQWSECARGGAAVKARRGDSLLFYRSVLPLSGLGAIACNGTSAAGVA